jgi:hypothetical protein
MHPEAKSDPTVEAGQHPGILGQAFGRVAARAASWPWYLQIALIYLAARAVSLAIFVAVARQQGPSPWYGAEPSYWEFINIWDSAWYRTIFSEGYPTEIPRDDSGAATENAWAFYALFPFTVRALSGLTGLGWDVLAPIVAGLAGLGAALVIYRLFRVFAGHGTAAWGVVFVSTFPVSPILQVPYAESLHLLLLASALYLVVVGRWLAAVPVVVLMSLARPAGVPFAVMLGCLLVYRWWTGRRASEPDRGGLLRLLVLTAAAGASALAWPVIAWAVTGELAAYTDTETVWRGGGLALFAPWFETGSMLFGPVLGAAAPVVLALAFVLCLRSAPVRRIGVEMSLWCAAYTLYLLAFLHPQTSTFRLLLPLFPLALGAAFLSRSRAYRGTVAVMFVLLQIVWVSWLWQWTQLPGGGDYPP